MFFGREGARTSPLGRSRTRRGAGVRRLHRVQLREAEDVKRYPKLDISFRVGRLVARDIEYHSVLYNLITDSYLAPPIMRL